MINTQTIIKNFIITELAPGRDNITPTTSLLNTGILDSLSLLRLMAFLETTFNIQITPDDVGSNNFESIAAISQFVVNK